MTFQQLVAWLCRRPINIKTIHGKKPAGRNDPCPCGSKIKHKHCCWSKHQRCGVTQEQVACSRKEKRYWNKRYKELKAKNE